MNKVQIKKMSTVERLQVMEALWESLLEEESRIVSPAWHEDVLEERKRKLKRGEAEFISLEELKNNRR